MNVDCPTRVVRHLENFFRKKGLDIVQDVSFNFFFLLASHLAHHRHHLILLLLLGICHLLLVHHWLVLGDLLRVCCHVREWRLVVDSGLVLRDAIDTLPNVIFYTGQCLGV